jgi:predicted ATP-binding protein involved in virulence
MPTPRASREPSSRKDVIEMVELYSSELADRISRTLAESVKIAQSRDRTFPTRLLRGEFSQVPSEVQLRDELSKIETKRQLLYSAGLLDEEEAVPLPQKTMNEMEQKVLSLYLHDVKEKLQVFDDLQTRIATLMALINSKIEAQGKSLVISRDKGFLFKTKFGVGKTLRPAELSSGEQHQLVLFYEFLFKTTSKSFVLIDEPEISLNVGWQRRFLDDLSKVIHLCGHSVLMATHSPQIIHNRWDLGVPLSGGVKE